MIEEIAGELSGYLKSGKMQIVPFLRELNLNIDNLKDIINIHFLMDKDVINFVLSLPQAIRRFKTSTTVENELLRGDIKGQIDWNKTINSRYSTGYNDKTLLSCRERNRFYNIKENLVLKELIEIIYNITQNSDFDKFLKYEWYKYGKDIKRIIQTIYEKNVYINRIKSESTKVTDRMIEDTIKSRNSLYSTSAKLLKFYRRILDVDFNSDDLVKLLNSTFIYADSNDTLFELYWAVRILRDNAVNEKMYIMDGSSSIIASWYDDKYRYEMYHDSTGSSKTIFQVLFDEIKESKNPYLERKVKSITAAGEIAELLFDDFDSDRYKYYWRGRPDIIVQITDKVTDELVKLILCEVKYTQRKDYMLTGLEELMDYIMLVRDKMKIYLYSEQNNALVKGILFVDDIDFNRIEDNIVKVISVKDKGTFKCLSV